MNDCLYELYKYTRSQHHLDAAHVFDEETSSHRSRRGKTSSTAGTRTPNPQDHRRPDRYRRSAPRRPTFRRGRAVLGDGGREPHLRDGWNSQLEHFHEPGQLDSRRDNTNNETCNSYNMLKLSRELFKITADVKYADFYERGSSTRSCRPSTRRRG
jgi:hypothetical protein